MSVGVSRPLKLLSRITDDLNTLTIYAWHAESPVREGWVEFIIHSRTIITDEAEQLCGNAASQQELYRICKLSERFDACLTLLVPQAQT